MRFVMPCVIAQDVADCIRDPCVATLFQKCCARTDQRRVVPAARRLSGRQIDVSRTCHIKAVPPRALTEKNALGKIHFSPANGTF